MMQEFFYYFTTVQITFFRHCEGVLVLARSNPSHNSEIASPPKTRSAARNDGYTLENLLFNVAAQHLYDLRIR